MKNETNNKINPKSTIPEQLSPVTYSNETDSRFKQLDKEKLKYIFQNTCDLCNNKNNDSLEIYKQTCVSQLYDNKILANVNLENKSNSNHMMEVKVINDDVLKIAEQYYTQGNIVVLNLASDMKPGGGVRTGAMAQEEELFRRSNYYLSLNQSFYPINKTNVIYTSKVTIIKDSDYQLLENPFIVSMIAAVGIRQPILTKQHQYQNEDYEIIYNTIDNIFRTAYANNHDILILGAIGCGVFHNPPKEIIKIYNIFIKKYYNCFNKIIFAIKSIGKDQNYDLFNQFIEQSK